MNNIQRAILSIYLPFTALILVFQYLYQEQNVVLYLKFMTMITMFLTGVIVKKKFQEQKMISAAMFFLVVSDFFFVYALTLDNFTLNRKLFGMLGFLLAYVFLSLAFNKNFRIGKGEIITAVPLLAAFLYVFITLKPYVQGFMFIAAIIFGFILCFMTWSAISSLFRGYFNQKTARVIAVAATLLFIGDLGGVAFSMFDPRFAEFVLWNKTLIWGTYVPGWTLLLYVLCEDNLLLSKVKKVKKK